MVHKYLFKVACQGPPVGADDPPGASATEVDGLYARLASWLYTFTGAVKGRTMVVVEGPAKSHLGEGKTSRFKMLGWCHAGFPRTTEKEQA